MSQGEGGGRPLKFKTPEELQKKIDAYFKDAEERDVPYTVSGLCYFLDCDRLTLLNYAKKDRFVNTIKKAKSKILRSVEERSFLVSNPAACIFNMKANFGMSDKQEIQLSGDAENPVQNKFVVEYVDKKPI